MSTKQLARTVIDGRLLHFRFASGVPSNLKGYLCGMDDFHWMIVTSKGQQHLVHKGSASIITIADEPSYADEPEREALEKLVAPYRSWVEANVYGRDPQPAREAIA